MDCLIDILIIIFQFVIYKKKLGKYINHISVVNLIWLSMTGLSKLQPYGLTLPSAEAYNYVYIMLLFFNIASLIFVKKRTTISVGNILINKPNYLLLVLSVFSFIALIKYLPSAINIFLTGGFGDLRENYLSGEDAEMKIGVYITWLVNALIITGFINSYITLTKKTTKKVKRITICTFVVNILNVLMYVCITGGRFLFILCLLSIIIKIWIDYSGRITVIFAKNKKIIIFLILCLLLTLYISSQRTLSELDFWGMLYVYFFATINMFSILIARTDTFSNHFYGTNLIGGFITPFIIFFNNHFGTDFQIPLQEINKVTSDFVWVSNNIHMNNNCTFLYGALRDFGSLGIIIYSVVYAWVLNLFYEKSFRRDNLCVESFYVFALAVSVFLLMEWMPCRPNIIFAPIFMWAIPKLNNVIFK